MRGAANQHGAAGLRRAFLLADAIVATVLLGLSLAVLLGLIGRVARTQRDGEHLETAAMLLDEQLALVLARGVDGYAQRFPLKGACDRPFQDYAFEIEIGPAGGSDAPTVTATISWMQGSVRKSESVQTKIAPRTGDEPDPDRKPQEKVIRQ